MNAPPHHAQFSPRDLVLKSANGQLKCPDTDAGVKEGTLNNGASETNSLYQPLKTESKEVRILLLQPGAWADPISCQLKTLPLSEADRQYEALSYAWDAEVGFHDILVNGHPYSIKKNLFLALRRLRKAAEPRTMWADALCINQQSNDEKSHQVVLMREIYQSCVRVFLWLGDYRTNSLDIRTVEDGIRTEPESWTRDDTMFKAFNMINELAAEKHFHELLCYHKNNERRPFDRGALEGFMALVSSSWWNRLWVVQEYVLSPQAIVICGSLSAPMQMFSAAMENAAKHGGGCCQKSWAKLRSNQANDMMLLWRKIKDLGQPQDVRDWAKFYHILLYHRNRKTNMVYGLSALAPDIPNELIPDYTLSKQEVYRRLALCLIRKQEKLHVFKGQRTLNEHYPSWIYDWSSDPDDELYYIECRRLEIEAYRASKGTKPVAQSHSDGRLSIDGVLFDRVVQMGQACEKNPSGRLKALREWYNICRNASNDLSPTVWRENFLRTVTGDATYSFNSDPSKHHIIVRAPADQEDVFDAWLKHMESPIAHRSSGDNSVDMFDDLIRIMTRGLKFFLTEKGFMGIGNAEVDDQVWVLLGGDVPFLLRRDTASASYFLVGDCFVHGIMDGEALEDPEAKTKTIELR
ncbi:hypothetical protein BDZ45DRAFT_810221 [Acephala macrosclerotiorum]|nr:hypothetical protein BDZ45DRAFT_810221 [Acephala macrosclerotiorum]